MTLSEHAVKRVRQRVGGSPLHRLWVRTAVQRQMQHRRHPWGSVVIRAGLRAWRVIVEGDVIVTVFPAVRVGGVKRG